MLANTNITPVAMARLRIWSVKRHGKSAPAEYSVSEPTMTSAPTIDSRTGSSTASRSRRNSAARDGITALIGRPAAPPAA
jgi:hypothetical protein